MLECLRSRSGVSFDFKGSSTISSLIYITVVKNSIPTGTVMVMIERRLDKVDDVVVVLDAGPGVDTLKMLRGSLVPEICLNLGLETLYQGIVLAATTLVCPDLERGCCFRLLART